MLLARADWDKIEGNSMPVTETGCLIYLGGGSRYGDMWTSRKRVERVHRISYEYHHGTIRSGEVVRHKCDTPYCVNPHHLIVGSQRDNVMDTKVRGRMRGLFKPTIPDSVKEEMREQRRKGERVIDIARTFGMDRGYTSRIVKGCQPKGCKKCHS